MEKEVKQRLQWVKMYQSTGDAGLTCRRCGISRPTLRKWWKRYLINGLNGLKSISKRPHTSPATKVNDACEKFILELRNTRKLGARRIQSELKRQNSISLAVATIHKILCKHKVKPLPTYKRRAPLLAISVLFLEKGFKWILVKLLLDCINIPPLMIVLAIEYYVYTVAVLPKTH